MKIEAACSWKNAVAKFSEQHTLLTDLLEKSRTCTTAIRELSQPIKKLGIIIGPEGDLSSSELEQAIAAGAIPVTLGNNILRVETAALYAVSVATEAVQAL